MKAITILLHRHHICREVRLRVDQSTGRTDSAAQPRVPGVRLSIKWKVFVPVAAVLVVGFALYSYVGLRAVERYLYQRADRSAASFAGVAERSLRLAMIEGDPEPVSRLMREIAQLPDVQRLRVVDKSGRTWIMAGRPYASDESDVHQLRQAAARSKSTVGALGGDWVYRAVRPVLGGPKCSPCHGDVPLLGFLEVDLRATSTREQLILSRRRLMWASGLMLAFVGIALVVALHLLVSSPLEELRSAMKRVQQGDLSARASISSGDELEDLGRSFNHMVNEIESKNQLLLRSEKLASIGLLAAGVAHEINNPVATISMSAESLLEMETCPAKRRFLQAIVEEAERVGGIVGKLLSLEPAKQAHAEPCNLEEAVRSALDALSREIERNHIKTVLQLDVRNCRVVGNQDQLVQALCNIIDNAVKAMPSGGVLTVRGHHRGGWCVLEVHDTGTGIAPEHLDKVFDPFFTTRDVGEGYGLGLSVTHEIIERHGGQISAASGPDGTTFTVRLPISEEAEHGGSGSPNTPGGRRSQSSGHSGVAPSARGARRGGRAIRSRRAVEDEGEQVRPGAGGQQDAQDVGNGHA